MCKTLEKEGHTAICRRIRRALTAAPARSEIFNTSSVVIPIECDRTIFVEYGKISHVAVEGKGNRKIKLNPSWSESDNSINQRFSDYINRARQKITKTGSDVGTGRIQRLDSVNNKASAYINRTRQRFRAS